MATKLKPEVEDVEALIAKFDGGVELPVEKIALGPHVPASGVAELLRCAEEGDQYAAGEALWYLGRVADCGRISSASKLKVVRCVMRLVQRGIDPMKYAYEGPDGELYGLGCGIEAVLSEALWAIDDCKPEARVALPVLCEALISDKAPPGPLESAIARIVASDPEVIQAIAALPAPGGGKQAARSRREA